MISKTEFKNYQVPGKMSKILCPEKQIEVRDELVRSKEDGLSPLLNKDIIQNIKSQNAHSLAEVTVTNENQQNSADNRVMTALKKIFTAIGGVSANVAFGIMEHVIKPVSFNIKSKKKLIENKIDSFKGKTLHKKDEIMKDLKISDSISPLTVKELKGAKHTGDMVRTYDGYDSSRDIFALYSEEGKNEKNYTFQLEVANLRDGAEYGHLDTYFLLNWGDKKGEEKLPFDLTTDKSSQPWKIAVKVDKNGTGEIVDSSGVSYGVPEHINHSTSFSNIEFQINKDTLRSLGWKDGETLNIQAFTAKDDDTKVSDTITASTDVKGSKEILDNIFRWDGKTVYYAVTDRFYDGDKTNNDGIDLKDKEKYHGGDWQGVIDKLDYIKDLGVDCVWLSCPYLNDKDFFGKDGFHGYWPHDFYKPEPHFGDMDKLRELTEKAHEKGIKIMLDVVVNHTGYNHPFVDDPSHGDWYHEKGDINGLSEYHMVNRSLAGLPDLAQENPDVKHYLIDSHKWWVEQSGIDAFRVDAARHVPEDFLREFNESLHSTKDNFYTVGEAFWRNPNFIAGLQNQGLDGMFDFPLAFTIRNVFASKKDEGLLDRLKYVMKNLSQHPGDALEKLLRKDKPGMKMLSEAMENDRYYDNPKKLGTMIDNHDMSRFMEECGGDKQMLEIALSFLMSARGNPCIYYGTEAGLDGAADNNRKDMPWGENPALTDSFRKMAKARGSSNALKFGTQVELKATRDIYAHARMRPEEEVICLFNNSGKEKEVSVPMAKDSQVLKGDVMEDLISGNKIKADEKNITVTIPPMGYAYYQWKKEN